MDYINGAKADPNFDINAKPDYLYWTDTSEMMQHNVTVDDLRWGVIKPAQLEGGGTFYFLSAYYSFSCATAGNCNWPPPPE